MRSRRLCTRPRPSRRPADLPRWSTGRATHAYPHILVSSLPTRLMSWRQSRRYRIPLSAAARGDTMFEGFRAVRQALDTGEVSSRDLVEACLDRISAVDDSYAAWMHVDAGRAVATAKEADTRRTRSARDPST